MGQLNIHINLYEVAHDYLQSDAQLEITILKTYSMVPLFPQKTMQFRVFLNKVRTRCCH